MFQEELSQRGGGRATYFDFAVNFFIFFISFAGIDIATSRKHLLIKVTPDFHLTYSKNGGNLGSESKR